jgi:hypothetical protein
MEILDDMAISEFHTPSISASILDGDNPVIRFRNSCFEYHKGM